jgi:hypothetical protein
MWRVTKSRIGFHSYIKIKVTSSSKKCSNQWDIDGWISHEDILINYGYSWRKSSRVLMLQLYLILSMVRHTIKRDASQGVLIMYQCSSNPCELRETQKPHVHVLGFDPVSNPVALVLGNRWHRFCVSRPNGYFLKYRWHRVWELGGTGFSLKFVTASFGKFGVSGVFPADSRF